MSGSLMAFIVLGLGLGYIAVFALALYSGGVLTAARFWLVEVVISEGLTLTAFIVMAQVAIVVAVAVSYSSVRLGPLILCLASGG